MSEFKLVLQTDNTAFYADDGTHDPAPEVARILYDIGKKIDRGQTDGAIRDGNGNRVGTWDLDIVTV